LAGAPDAVVVPMAGGALITKIHKAFNELTELGLISEAGTRFYGHSRQAAIR
jgi:threonine synthase